MEDFELASLGVGWNFNWPLAGEFDNASEADCFVDEHSSSSLPGDG